MSENGTEGLPPCCKDWGERVYQEHLQKTNSHDNPALLDLLRWLMDNLGRYLLDLSKLTLLRVANTPRFVNAFTGRTRCDRCSSPVSIVVIGSNLLLLTWRLQMIYISMIERWDQQPDGLNTRHRVYTRKPTKEEIRQAKIAAEIYLKGERVTDEGLDELVQWVGKGPEPAREYLSSAVNVGELWIVGHEISHVLIDNWRRFPELKNSLDHLNAFFEVSESYTRNFNLLPKYHDHWVNEFLADICSAYTLLLSISERQQNLHPQIGQRQNNEMSAMMLLGGIGATCDALYFAARLAPPLLSHNPCKTAHPPLHLRFDLLNKYIQTMFSPNVTIDINSMANLIAGCSRTFYSEWENDSGRRLW